MEEAASFSKLLESEPSVKVYCSLWFFLYGLVSVILLCTATVAAGFVALLSFVGVTQGCTLGSDFFIIGCQGAAVCVNREFPEQTFRLIVDDYGSAGPPKVVKAAIARFDELTAMGGMAKHDGKAKLVAGRLSMDELLDAGYSESTNVVDGMVFTGLPIADISTEAGRAFVDSFFGERLARFSMLVERLRSVRRRQDAYAILRRVLCRRMDHLFYVAPLLMDECKLRQIRLRHDEILLLGLAHLVKVSSLPKTAQMIFALPLRHTGAGLQIGPHRALVAASVFFGQYAAGLGVPLDDTPYGQRVAQWRAALETSYPGVRDIFESEVKGRLESRVMAYIGDQDAFALADELSAIDATKRSGMPRDGYFLQSIGTHSAEQLSNSVWTGLARQFLQLPLLSSSTPTMESSQMLNTCLTCGCPDLDNLGDHARFCGGNSLATRLHTKLKWLLASMVKAVAAVPSSGVTGIVVEKDGDVRGRLRPADVAFKVNDVAYAVDVYGTCCYGPTSLGTPVEKLFENVDQEKIDYYHDACKEQEITFFTFGIDAMGRLSESALSFMRWITNCLEDPPCGHAAFLHYWSRRLVVAYMATQMRFLLARQKERDPCFSYVSDAALQLDNCDAHMPGGPSCDGTSNRGLRRDAAAFPTSRLSV